MKLVLLVALLGVAYVAAECPEACNGHGFCGEYDKCSCYRNWQGNSCADRTCPSDVAFVDLPKGDLNMDGNLDDTITTYGAQINDIYAFEVYPTDGYQINRGRNTCKLVGTCSGGDDDGNACSGDDPAADCTGTGGTCVHGDVITDTVTGATVYCDAATDCPNADDICAPQPLDASSDDIMYTTLTAREKAASFYDQAEDGHFYAECSNKGMCDRKSGQCDCFDGYSGTACRRVACPNDCSGHGTCETIAETSADGGSYTYQLWDRYKTQVCSCDPGYFGIDCAQRHCPYGDDPLSADEHNEIQWLTLRTHGAGTNGPTTPTAEDLDLEGTFRLAYKDEYGETWNTSPISAMSYDVEGTCVGGDDDGNACVIDSDCTGNTNLCSGGNDNTGLAAAIKAALEGIPNSVFEEVDVEIWPIQTPIPGVWGCAEATSVATCTIVDSSATLHKVAPLASNAFGETSEQTEGGGAETTGGVLSRTLSSSVLTGSTEKWGVSNCAQLGNGGLFSAEADLDNADGTIVAVAGLGTTPTTLCRYDMNGFRAKITFKTNPGDINELTCDADLVTTAEHKDSSAPATDIVCTAKDQLNLELGGVGTLVGSTIGGGNGGQIQTNMDLSAMVTHGDRIVFTTGSGGSAVVNTCTIAGPVVAPTAVTAGAATNAAIICEEEFAAAVTIDAINQGAAHWLGRGTTENVECSHRGLCNHDEGLCECFTGYTHDDCSRQDALNA